MKQRAFKTTQVSLYPQNVQMWLYLHQLLLLVKQFHYYCEAKSCTWALLCAVNYFI